MRKLVAILCAGMFLTGLATAQTAPNPLFASPDSNPFGSSFFTAPGTNTLPDGTEVPPPVPEAVLGPGTPLCEDRFWLAADFLYVAGRPTRLPPLVTASPAGTNPLTAGVLGQPTTTTLFGGNRLSELRPGLRVGAGGWFTERWGADGSFLLVSETDAAFGQPTGPGGPILAQPVILGATGTETAVPVSIGLPGGIEAKASTRTIGGDVNLRYALRQQEYGRFDLLAGYRYLQLWDGARLSTNRGGAFVEDNFRTRNDFHGPQVGFASTHRLFDRLLLSTRATVGLGVTQVETQIAGATVAAGVATNTGLLASASNSGRFTNTDFSVLPAAEVMLGYDVTDHLRVNVGYSYLYWSRVERAGDQIDRTVLAPGRPAYPADATDYWVQGIILGVELRY